jgi:hypothetical protein
MIAVIEVSSFSPLVSGKRRIALDHGREHLHH